jgi:hypothetical protein
MPLLPTVGNADSLGPGVTINGSGWKGDNGSGNSSFESDDGGQLALSINYRNEKFIPGLIYKKENILLIPTPPPNLLQTEPFFRMISKLNIRISICSSVTTSGKIYRYFWI